MSRNTLALLGLIAASVLSAGASAADPQAVRYYEDAVTRFNSGDLKGAEIQLKNSLTRDPGQLSARILMGQVQLGLGNAEQAEEALETANKLGADTSVTALPLTRAHNRLGKQQLIIDSLVPTDFSIDQQPDLWVELGIARLQNKDIPGARIAFEQALKIQPLHAGGALGLARIPLVEGDFAEAEHLATAAVENFPDNAQAWFLKASALHAQGKNMEAADAYARARDIDPGHSSAGLGEATALLDANQTARAEALLQELRAAYPWMPEAPYLQSKVLKRLGRDEEAESALSAASDILNPITPSDLADSPALLRLAGTIAYEDGQSERAFQAISLYLQARPEDVSVRKLLARIALGMQKPDEAKRALVPVVTAGKADAETLALLGDANAQLNDYIAAESYYRDAIANYQGGPALIGRLGALQYRQGQREQALDILQGLVGDEQAGATAGVSLYTAMLLFAEGQLDDARKIADRLVEEQPENLLVLNLQATLAIASGENANGHRMLTALLAKDSSFRPARYNLAKLHVLEGQYREAEAVLRTFLAEDPNDVRALQQLAQLELARNDRRDAIAHYEKIRQIDDKALIPSIELIDLYLAESRPADAMNAAATLNRALPDNFYAQETLARVQLARNEPEDVRSTLIKTAQLAGYDPRKLMRTARLQQAARAYDDAVWTLLKVLNERPDAIAARRALAETWFRQGKMEEASQEVERLLAAAPDDLFALALKGDIQLARGEPQRAAETFARALQLDDRPALLVSHFRAKTLAGQGEAALANLQAWQDTHPDNPLVLRALAEGHHQRGATDAALPLYERLIELTPNEALVHNNMANLLMDLDVERALKAARRAHELARSNPAILDTLGWALVQVGELNEGLSVLREAVARNGQSATMRYHLGVALEEFGNLPESKRELTRALQFAGGAPWANDAKWRLQRLQ
ncbi:MAG: XrtA/PEP-CTERM system TPR-repeat protein PrsT [Sedimenticolaceae bacterium]